MRLPVRKNYRGEEIPAAAGVLFVVPALALCALLAVAMPQARHAALLQAGAVAVFAGLGLLDDLCGNREFGGVRGHVMALLRHGRVTTGLVKLIGGCLAAVALGWLAAPRPGEALLNGMIIAASANMINLLDLRPGRALKAFALGGIALAPAAGVPGALSLLAVAVPAALYAPRDLRARAMMGDTGANALGAALGMVAVLEIGMGGRLALLLALIALQLLSEFVSFSAVIDRCPPLRFVDRLGRRGQ